MIYILQNGTTTKQTVHPNVVTDPENIHVYVSCPATQNYVLVRIWFISYLEDQTESVAACFKYTHLLRAKMRRYDVMMVGRVTPWSLRSDSVSVTIVCLSLIKFITWQRFTRFTSTAQLIRRIGS